MLIDFLLELKESIDRHGVRMGVIFALYAVYRKERRNYRLDKRDEAHDAYFTAILENQRLIMDRLGVEPCADTFTVTTTYSARPGVGGYVSSWAEKLIARYARKSMSLNTRRIKMNQFLSGKKKYLTFILLVVLNGLNDTLQLHLSQETITNVSALGGGYILIEGILDIVRSFANRNGGKPNEPTQHTGDSGAAV